MPAKMPGRLDEAVNLHVDLDDHGRSQPPQKVSQLDLDAQRRQEALGKLGEISRRRSAVHDGDFVESDLCGRGDPKVFAEIHKRLSLVNGGELLDRDLDAIAGAQVFRELDVRRTPLRRSASHHRRKSKNVAPSGFFKFFKFNRSSFKAEQ